MIRVNVVTDIETYELTDKNGIKRNIKVYVKNGDIYLGPLQTFFNRIYVLKDKNRIDFLSKLDNNFNELMHISRIFEKMEEFRVYSYFTTETIKNLLYTKGFSDNDFKLKRREYVCALENFIEYGFNSMNFCLDKNGDIWVHYKEYEEQKQYRDISSNLSSITELNEFDKEYRQLVKFINYGSLYDDNELKCFTLKSINITKLYHLLIDYKLLHKVKYVSDIYNETLRELSFTDINVNNTYVKVVHTEDGFKLKEPVCNIVA